MDDLGDIISVVQTLEQLKSKANSIELRYWLLLWNSSNDFEWLMSKNTKSKNCLNDEHILSPWRWISRHIQFDVDDILRFISPSTCRYVCFTHKHTLTFTMCSSNFLLTCYIVITCLSIFFFFFCLFLFLPFAFTC